MSDVRKFRELRTRLSLAAPTKAPTPATTYILEIYSPADRHPWMHFEASTPFQAIAAGDVLDTRTWPVRTWPRTLASHPLRVTRVEHIIFQVGKRPPCHSLQVFTTEEALEVDALDEESRALSRKLAQVPRDEREWAESASLAAPKGRAQKGAKGRP